MGLKQDSKVLAWHFDVSKIYVNKRWVFKELHDDNSGDVWQDDYIFTGFYTDKPFLPTKTMLSGEQLRTDPFVGFDLLRKLINDDIDLKEKEDELFPEYVKDFREKNKDFRPYQFMPSWVIPMKADPEAWLKSEDNKFLEIKTVEEVKRQVEYFNLTMDFKHLLSQNRRKYIGEFLNKYGDFYGVIWTDNGVLSYNRNTDPIAQRLYPSQIFGNLPKPIDDKRDRKGYWVHWEDFFDEALGLVLATELWASLSSPNSISSHPTIDRETYISLLASRWLDYLTIKATDHRNPNHIDDDVADEIQEALLGTTLHYIKLNEDYDADPEIKKRKAKIPEENKYQLLEQLMLFYTQKHSTSSSLKAVPTEAGTTMKELVIVKSIGDFYWANLKYTILAHQSVSVCQYSKCQKYFQHEKSNQKYCLEITGMDCQVKAKELRRYERNKQWKKGRNG